MLHFGIGCLSFEMDFEAEPDINRWAQVVENGLNALHSVEDVRVGVTGTQTYHEDSADGAFDFSATPLAFSPQPAMGSVEFRVKIHSRLRKDLLPWADRDCGENFFVQTVYGMGGPSTFVICLDALPRPGGNVAVVLVREFLKSELRGTDGLRLGTLGPSPFHTDGVIEGTATGAFSVDVIPGGYTCHQFKYDPVKYTSDLEALRELHLAVSHELSAFYELTRLRNRRLVRASQIGGKAEALIATHRASGWGASTRRLLGTGRAARELGLDVLSAEFAVARDKETAAETVRYVYGGRGIHAFREELELVASEDFPAYLQNASDVVRLLESGRTKELEIAMVSASTLLGGAAGAVAAILSGG